MPPSGYNIVQSKAIEAFLSSCAKALEMEGLEKSFSAVEALDAECRSILHYLDTSKQGKFSEDILKLTYAFYTRILELGPLTYTEFRDKVQICLVEVEKEVIGIHIPGQQIKPKKASHTITS